jgi:hypothetical protein
MGQFTAWLLTVAAELVAAIAALLIPTQQKRKR